MGSDSTPTENIAFNIQKYGVGVGQLTNGTSASPELTINSNWKVEGLFPVGSVYISVDNTNPSTYFGGSWINFGDGRVLVGVDSSDTDFSYAGKSGGESTHKLTVSELPSHKHLQGFQSDIYYHGSSMTRPRVSGYNSNYTYSSSVGSGGAHNNMQPYITCYFWYRDA